MSKLEAIGTGGRSFASLEFDSLHSFAFDLLPNMPRNRKSKTKTVDETVQPANNIQISEEEQWRLINQTGILKDAMPRPSPVVEEEEGLSFGDEIFNAIILIIPFSFLLLMFEM